jgi:hypothetical protein
MQHFQSIWNVRIRKNRKFRSCIETICSSNHDTENKCWDIVFLKNFRWLLKKNFSNWKNETLFRELKKRINHESFLSECSNTNLTSTTIWRNSRHDYVSKMIFNRLIRTRMRSRWLLKRFVSWWSSRLSLISNLDNTMRSMLSSIMKLMKNYKMNARTNFLDSIIVENWIKFCMN